MNKLLNKKFLNKLRKEYKLNLKHGRIGFGVLAVLALVGTISIGLVFGIRQLSPYTSSELANYLCCDTGDGDLCKPVEDSAIQVRFSNKANAFINYSLLKSNVKFSKDFFHIDPIPISDARA